MACRMPATSGGRAGGAASAAAGAGAGGALRVGAGARVSAGAAGCAATAGARARTAAGSARARLRVAVAGAGDWPAAFGAARALRCSRSTKPSYTPRESSPVLPSCPMPSTRQPFSRRRMTSGAKSESDDTITTTAGGCVATRSMASTASAMSVAFLPVERLTMGRIEWRLKNCWCFSAVSAVQCARRT